jgi:hypothetical protein
MAGLDRPLGDQVRHLDLAQGKTVGGTFPAGRPDPEPPQHSFCPLGPKWGADLLELPAGPLGGVAVLKEFPAPASG